MKRLHLVAGLAGVIAFLATGLYMHFGHDHLRGMSDAQRLLFRSTHIYLLLCALVNLGLGMYIRESTGWRRVLQGLGSLIVLATSVFALLGFCYEPWLSDLERPFSRAAAYGALAGMMMHLLAWLCGKPWSHTSDRKIAE